jgi:Cu2+-exporting ATPase
MLTLATAALWLWLDPSQAVAHVVALLVVTCPCALGMATPLSMAVAAGRAARSGVFIKTDEATQRLTDITTVVLDKTGTLTEGHMTVASVVGEASALDLAAALEAQASHPIAAAAPARDDLPVRGLAVTTGAGVRGFVAGIEVVVGKPSWVAAETRALNEELAAAVEAALALGHTPVAVGVDGSPRAVLAVGDSLRPESAALVQHLHARGLAVHILSGDHPAVVRSVAAQLGIPAERAQGGVGPEAKRDAVAALQADGAVVLMVGDGVNDAAALQAADVGVAVGGGATASLVAADVFVVRPGVQPIAELLDGAARVMRTIRGTLGLSLAYNVVGHAHLVVARGGHRYRAALLPHGPMIVLYVLVPLALLLAALGVAAFGWAVRDGQFDDVETPALRILLDDDEIVEPPAS